MDTGDITTPAASAPTAKKPNKLEVLEAISRRLKGRAVPDVHGERSAISRRSKAHAELGLSDLALQDCVEALQGKTATAIGDILTLVDAALKPQPEEAHRSQSSAPPTEPVLPRYALLGRLAEALRVYVRDVLFSEPPEKMPPMEEAIKKSIGAFTQALDQLAKETGKDLPLDDPRLAWIRAHRGAAYSLLYWMLVTNGSTKADAVFEDAQKDFSASQRRGGKEYVWSIRFQALLITLRAQVGDFAKARELLESVMGLDPVAQSSLHRSLSMLNSYETAEAKLSSDVREQAARAGIVAGGAAVEEDAEDHIAAYFTAANWWWLATNERDATLRDTHIAAHRAAISSARIRSRNAISQALAGLVGLELMEALPPAGDHEKTAIDGAKMQRLQELMDLLDRFPPDFETRLIFARDPVYATIKQQMPQASQQLQASERNYDKLSQKYLVNVEEAK